MTSRNDSRCDRSDASATNPATMVTRGGATASCGGEPNRIGLDWIEGWGVLGQFQLPPNPSSGPPRTKDPRDGGGGWSRGFFSIPSDDCALPRGVHCPGTCPLVLR
ncbi:hypothetical protein NL676_006944 [Syzygium grande]|nr:hypothetical protein NL676_006944 [Syzygium grande]